MTAGSPLSRAIHARAASRIATIAAQPASDGGSGSPTQTAIGPGRSRHDSSGHTARVPAQRDRHHGHPFVERHLERAEAERHHPRRGDERALREDEQRVALVDRGRERGCRVARAALDQHIVGAAQDGAEDRIAGEPRLGAEPDGRRQHGEQQEHVEEAGVVGDDHRRRGQRRGIASFDVRAAPAGQQQHPRGDADHAPRLSRRPCQRDGDPQRQRDDGDGGPHPRGVEERAGVARERDRSATPDDGREAAPTATPRRCVRGGGARSRRARASWSAESCPTTSWARFPVG